MVADIIALPGAASEAAPTPPRQHGRYASDKIVPQGALIAKRNKNRAVREAEHRARKGNAAWPEQEGNAAQREMIETLEWMLHQARGGKVEDLCGVFTHEGKENVVRTGKYLCQDTAEAFECIYERVLFLMEGQ